MEAVSAAAEPRAYIRCPRLLLVNIHNGAKQTSHNVGRSRRGHQGLAGLTKALQAAVIGQRCSTADWLPLAAVH